MHSSTHRAIACIIAFFSVAVVANAQITPAKEPTATITGKVTIKGKGVAGVIVALRQNDSSVSGRQFSGPKGVTDNDGNYRIVNVPPGSYRILPAAKAFVPVEEYDREKVLLVNKGDTIEHIDFAVVRGAVITGRVVDADGNPIIEERVQVFTVPDNKNVYVPMSPVTDDRGVFRIYGLRSGSYRVAAGHGEESLQSGPTRPYRRTYHPSVSDPSQATIVEVSEGDEIKDVDITLTRRVTTFAASGRLVEAETGQPIAGVGYSLTRHDDERGSSSGSWGATTNSRGEFKIENLSPGKFAISMSAPQGSDLRFDEVRFEITDQDVSGLVVKARKAASISGVVVFEGVDDKTAREQFSKVWAGALIEGGGSGGSSARIGEDGSFHITGLPAGTAHINVYANGNLHIERIERDGVIQSRGITLTEREHVKGIRVVVQFGNASLRGKIEVANGTLPADGRFFVLAKRIGSDATIMFSGSEGRPQVDERGQFVIEGLPAGTYEIQAGVFLTSAKLVYLAKKQVVLTADATTNADITVDLSSTPIKP